MMSCRFFNMREKKNCFFFFQTEPIHNILYYETINFISVSISKLARIFFAKTKKLFNILHEFAKKKKLFSFWLFKWRDRIGWIQFWFKCLIKTLISLLKYMSLIHIYTLSQCGLCILFCFRFSLSFTLFLRESVCRCVYLVCSILFTLKLNSIETFVLISTIWPGAWHVISQFQECMHDLGKCTDQRNTVSFRSVWRCKMFFIFFALFLFRCMFVLQLQQK